MAFHLHRLGLVGISLIRAGYDANSAADLAAARRPLKPDTLTKLAEQLGIAEAQLTRALYSDETRQWAFYRASARNARVVWEAARAAWKQAGLSDSEASTILGYSRSVLTRAKKAPGMQALSFAAALRLTTALNITQGPETFLPLRKCDDPGRSDCSQ